MAQMSAASIATSGVSGGDLATFTNSAASALNSGNRGVSRPAHIATGGLWTKQVTGGDELYEFNGTTDIYIGKLNNTGPAFEMAGTTAFTRTLLDDADAATARATLGNVLEPIASDVVTGASLSQIVFSIPAAFSGFVLDVQEFLPSVNAEVLALQLGTGTVGSPTWQTSYGLVNMSGGGGSTFSGTSSPTSMAVLPGISSNAAFTNASHVRVTGMNSSGPANMLVHAGGVNGSTVHEIILYHGRQETNATRTVARLIPGSGTISGIRYQLYGVRAF